MSDDETLLYEVDIRPQASPAEVNEWTALLEQEGYRVVTDLSRGQLHIHADGEADD